MSRGHRRVRVQTHVFARKRAGRHTACIDGSVMNILQGTTACGLFGLATLWGAETGCAIRACDDLSDVRQLAVFDLSCAPTDLTTVDVSVPCAAADASTDPSNYVRGNQIWISSGVSGTCHVALTFATGFTYSADVTFTATTDSCGTTDVRATQTVFAVDNPSSTCPDGGELPPGD